MPPLTALRVFEAAARHLSFKKAADELHVTPAAISHQITLLEDFLGVRLFERRHRALALTPAAAASLDALSAGFNSIKLAVQSLGGLPSTPLTVSCPPTFAHRWLLPKLHQFVSLYPEIDIQVTTQLDMVRDIRRRSSSPEYRIVELAEIYDVVLAFGRPETCPLAVKELLSLDITLLCSPSLIAENPITDLREIAGFPILHDGRGPMYSEEDFWRTWLAAADMPFSLAERGRRFSHSFLALDAAVHGEGLVVSTPALATEYLAAGRLVMPFGLKVPIAQKYYLAVQETKARDAQVRLFTDWLVSVCGNSQEADAFGTLCPHQANMFEFSTALLAKSSDRGKLSAARLDS